MRFRLLHGGDYSAPIGILCAAQSSNETLSSKKIELGVASIVQPDMVSYAQLSSPSGRQEGHQPMVLDQPSPHAGLARALVASYVVPRLPPELARLIAKLS